MQECEHPNTSHLAHEYITLFILIMKLNYKKVCTFAQLGSEAWWHYYFGSEKSMLPPKRKKKNDESETDTFLYIHDVWSTVVPLVSPFTKAMHCTMGCSLFLEANLQHFWPWFCNSQFSEVYCTVTIAANPNFNPVQQPLVMSF